MFGVCLMNLLDSADVVVFIVFLVIVLPSTMVFAPLFGLCIVGGAVGALIGRRQAI